MTQSLPPALAQRIRTDIQSMAAYAVQNATGLLKLDAMENPHRLSPALQAELAYGEGLQAHARAAELRLDTVPPMRGQP